MQKAPDHVQTLEKLKKLVADRYGRSLVLRRLTSIEQLSSDEDFKILDEDLHIPLRIKDAYLGTAVIPEGANLPKEKSLQIAQVVKMVLEPSLYRDFLERTETNLQLSSDSSDELSLSFPSENPDLRIFDHSQESISSLDRPTLVSPLIHLRGHDLHRLKKAALLLHEMTARWAFVPLNDLNDQIQDLNDFMRLGAVTVYVEDVETMNPSFQDTLMKYLESPRAAGDPIIITGSIKSTGEIAVIESLRSDLRDELVINTLELDRAPLTDRGLKEVLSLMFFETKGEA